MTSHETYLLKVKRCAGANLIGAFWKGFDKSTLSGNQTQVEAQKQNVDTLTSQSHGDPYYTACKEVTFADDNVPFSTSVTHILNSFEISGEGAISVIGTSLAVSQTPLSLWCHNHVFSQPESQAILTNIHERLIVRWRWNFSAFHKLFSPRAPDTQAGMVHHQKNMFFIRRSMFSKSQTKHRGLNESRQQRAI